MSHGVRGSVTVDGKEYSFDGGTGYLEMDRGSSFPRDYLWVQCNDFPEKCGVMAAVARIPFCGGHFRGCICAIVYRGREYRLATYRGARVRRADGGHICLTQGALCLKMDMKPRNSGCPLDAPRQGRMTGTIRESCNADLRVRLWERGKPVLDLKSGHAAYEFVPPSGRAR